MLFVNAQEMQQVNRKCCHTQLISSSTKLQQLVNVAVNVTSCTWHLNDRASLALQQGRRLQYTCTFSTKQQTLCQREQNFASAPCTLHHKQQRHTCCTTLCSSKPDCLTQNKSARRACLFAGWQDPSALTLLSCHTLAAAAQSARRTL
jgi:hypothetical protein